MAGSLISDADPNAVGRVRRGGRGPSRAQGAPRRDLRSEQGSRRARLGPEGRDAARRPSGSRRGDGDGRPNRAREVRRRGDRPSPRPAATARGVARLRLGRREPDPRHPPRLGEAAPGPDRAADGDDPRGRARQPGLDRGAGDQRLPEVPPGARTQPRAQAPLRRVLRVGGLAVHAAARRLRAAHADVGGGGGVRHDPPRARRAREGGAARRRVVPAPALPGGRADAPSTTASSGHSASRTARTASTRPSIPSARPSRDGTCA